MTDDLTMQQVPQQAGNHAASGFITGALIGGAGGAALAHYKNMGITQKPDLDKVFSQEPDSFTSQIEKAEGDNKTFLEKAKEKVEEFANLGKKYDEAAKKVQDYENKTADQIKEAIEGEFNGKTREEVINNAKKEAKESLKDLAEKAKFANKTLTGLVAGGILGILGLCIGASMKKD